MISSGQSLLLADEPTGALDSKASKNLLEIMTTMNQDMGATILMVTHDAYSASYAKRVTDVFLDGQGIQQVEVLKHKAQPLPAELCQRFFGQIGNAHAVKGTTVTLTFPAKENLTKL